jgi:AcrR family transcriptional regulator
MSTSIAHESAPKKRTYRLGRRAQKQALTRQRIVEAAVELHGSVGPARTSIAQIAERAGVQRHTFYAHFPDERSLVQACSGLALERDPLPAVEAWLDIAPGRDRIRHGLQQIYSWYARNEQLTAAVLRDAEVHELTREIVQSRMLPTFSRALELLGEGLEQSSLALLGVALDFACWRVLSRSCDSAAAASLMSTAILRVEP